MSCGQVSFFARLMVWAALVVISACVAEGAMLQLPLDVTQQAKADGSVEYQVHAIPLSFGPVSTRAIAPDGTEFKLPDLSGPGNTQVEGLSFADVASRFFGPWKIREVPLFGGGATAEYQFTFSPFTLDSVLHEPPHIVSPADGATVGPDFAVTWAYASGATPSNRLISWSGVTTTVDFAASPLPQATMHVDLTSSSSNQLTVWAGTLNSLAAYVSPVTPVGTPGPNQFQLRSNFRNLSVPVNLTVVPEPSTIALLLVGLGVFCVVRSAPSQSAARPGGRQ